MRSKCVLLLLAILSQPAPATLILYEHSKAEVLMGTDSLQAEAWPDGSLSSMKTCKLYQHGNAFFVYSGILDRELFTIAKRAAESASGSVDIMLAFDAMARPVIEKLFALRLAERLAAEFGTSGGQEGLDVIVVDMRGVLAHATYYLQDGSTFFSLSVYGVPGKRAFHYGKWVETSRPELPIAMGAAGFFENVVDASDRAPGLDRMIARFDSQITYDEGRLASGKRARVGGPVSILRVANGKAEWVEGYQGACPAVR